MTPKQLERMESAVNQIRREVDRWDVKMDKALAENNPEKYDKYDKRQDMALERLHGMETVLMILGYRVVGHVEGDWQVVKA